MIIGTRQLKTILRRLEAINGSDLLEFIIKTLSKEEKEKIFNKNLTLEIENAKTIIRANYLKEFDKYSSVVEAVKELQKIRAKKEKIEREKIRLETDIERNNAEKHYRAIFESGNLKEAKEFYKKIYNFDIPKVKRGFTKAELRALRVKDDSTMKRFTANGRDIDEERIFNLAEEIALGLQGLNDNLINADTVYKEGGIIESVSFVRDNVSEFYHLNEKHTENIAQYLKMIEEDYYNNCLEHYHDRFSNFQEWFNADRLDEEIDEWHKYEDDLLCERDPHAWIKFSFNHLFSTVIFTVEYGMHEGEEGKIVLQLELDLKKLLDARVYNREIVERMASLIKKSVERDRLFTNLNFKKH